MTRHLWLGFGTALVLFGCSSPQEHVGFRPDAVTANAYPFAVNLDAFGADGAQLSECSGAIVAPTLVLTARHCIAASAKVEVFAPYVGQGTRAGRPGTAAASPDAPPPSPARPSTSARTTSASSSSPTPIALDTYPTVGDHATCAGCEVVALGRVAPAASEGHASDARIVAGNAGGPIVRASDGAILGVSAGTLAPTSAGGAHTDSFRGDSDSREPRAVRSQSDVFVSPLQVAFGIGEHGTSILLRDERELAERRGGAHIETLTPTPAPDAQNPLANVSGLMQMGSGAMQALQQFLATPQGQQVIGSLGAQGGGGPGFTFNTTPGTFTDTGSGSCSFSFSGDGTSAAPMVQIMKSGTNPPDCTAQANAAAAAAQAANAAENAATAGATPAPHDPRRDEPQLPRPSERHERRDSRGRHRHHPRRRLDHAPARRDRHLQRRPRRLVLVQRHGHRPLAARELHLAARRARPGQPPQLRQLLLQFLEGPINRQPRLPRPEHRVSRDRRLRRGRRKK